ncbi:MAG: transaldolase [Bowdeniella nasicola]|nr:transaldolase [Bowdeniella nasicola]
MMTPYESLSDAGVSIWLDDLSREALRAGSDVCLADDVAERDVVGVTTNPSIFAAAIGDGAAYRESIARLLDKHGDPTVEDVTFALMIEDVQTACDQMRPVFDASDGVDGRVSIEVDPRLAHDTDRTIEQARMLWHAVDRPNLHVKIPATAEGLPAIAAVIGEGINVNVTLIFSEDRYRAVLGAYLDGLHVAARNGLDLTRIHSVASVFISRTDSKVDPLLDSFAESGRGEARELRGEVGIAVARRCYADFLESIASPRFTELEGARPQRPLWASTGVKDPAYEPTRYVTSLIAPTTVNTMPRATLMALGELEKVPKDTVRPFLKDAAHVLERVEAVGVDLDRVYAELEREGVDKFIDAWNQLCDAVSAAMEAERS